MNRVVKDFGLERIESVEDVKKVVIELIDREISIQDNARIMKNIGVITEEEREKIVSSSTYACNKLNKIYLLLPSKQENE